MAADCSVQSPPSSNAGGAGSYPASQPLGAALSARTAVLPGLWQSALRVLCTLLIFSMVLRSRWTAEKLMRSGKVVEYY